MSDIKEGVRWTTVSKKFLNGITGLGLVAFVILHLSENLLLLSKDPDRYNSYAHFLWSLGPILTVLEVLLLLVFLLHIVSAVSVYLQNRRARRTGYSLLRSRGKPSRKTISSVTMIVTGLVLLAFLVWHVLTFRFGSGVAEGYVTLIDGSQARDLYRLVMEFFSLPFNVVAYVVVMVLLGFHLRHGFWSAFQSLGVNHPKYSPFIYAVGIAVAVVLAVGFLLLPVVLYLRGGV